MARYVTSNTYGLKLGEETLELLDDDPATAKDRARDQLALIEEGQQKVGHELHKGQAFHNIGIAEVIRNLEAARVWFLAAHVEVARSSPRGTPFDQQAAVVLSVVYGSNDDA